MQPVSHLPLALTKYGALSGHFEAFNCPWAHWKKKGPCLQHFLDKELLSERKLPQENFDDFTLKPEIAMT